MEIEPWKEESIGKIKVKKKKKSWVNFDEVA